MPRSHPGHSNTPSFGKVFSPLPVHPQCSQVNCKIFQFEYHGYRRFCPTVGSGGRSLDLHLGISVLLISLPPTFIIPPQVLAAQAFAPDTSCQIISRSSVTPTSTS